MTIDLRDRALTLALSAGIHPEPTEHTIARARMYMDFLTGKGEAPAPEPKRVSIYDIGLRFSVARLLAFDGIETLAELLAQKEQELLLITGFGKGALAMVVNRLDAMGLRLASNAP